MTPSRSTSAFETLYQAEYARVLRFFRKRVGGDDAPDLAQEVFTRVFAAGAAEHIENPPAYLVRCARNVLIDRARRRALAHVISYPLDEGRDAPVFPEQMWRIEELDARKVYRRAIMAMPRRTRRIFLMHRLKGMTYSEISEQIGMSCHGVEYHMMRALAQCRRAAPARRF